VALLTATIVLIVVVFGTATLSNHLLLAVVLALVLPGLALLLTRGHPVLVRRRDPARTAVTVAPDDELAPVPLDGRTAASVTLGLAGLFVFNVLFGPAAVALAIGSIRRGAPGRWGRPAAVAGLTLGLLDLLVFVALLAARTGDGTFSWQLHL
jgi:hypothetical protein